MDLNMLHAVNNQSWLALHNYNGHWCPLWQVRFSAQATLSKGRIPATPVLPANQENHLIPLISIALNNGIHIRQLPP